jgi:serine/threonine protein phosphatase PrpC
VCSATAFSLFVLVTHLLTSELFVRPDRKFTALCMSEDHKPTREDEAKRIRDAGGFVINNRVMGELAVSRAFGDVDFKKGLQVGV